MNLSSPENGENDKITHNKQVIQICRLFVHGDPRQFRCNDMDEFHKGPAFPWGARSDGDLVIPTGQSYMTWSSIATGSGWHGPVYTHVLERPFRLYQLSEFSVVGELMQSSSTKDWEKHMLALFDE